MTGADACAAVGLPGGALWRPDDRRSRNVGLPVSFCCVVLPIVDARTSTPPEEQVSAACLPTATISTSATSASTGYRLLGAYTGLYSSRNIRTITTLRLRGDFNPSAPTFGLYSSLIVCGAPVATAGDVRLCVSVCGPASLLGCRPIRVRVSCVSIYCSPSLCNTLRGSHSNRCIGLFDSMMLQTEEYYIPLLDY
jgi:hypothetical protein